MILSDYKLEYIFEVKKNADLCPDLDNFWTYMSRFFSCYICITKGFEMGFVT